MASDMPDRYLHDQSPEAIEAAPVARELVRARITNQGSLMNGILEDFRQLRDDESNEQRLIRQEALIGCLARVAVEALLTLYQDEGEPVNQELVDIFLQAIGDAGVTI